MKLLLAGFGFIGKNFIRAVNEKITLLKSVDRDFKVVGVATSQGVLYSSRGLDVDKLSRLEKASQYGEEFEFGGSVKEFLEEGDADIIVVATPTNIETGEPGLTYIRTALRNGVDVVTADKGPLVLEFWELTRLAERNGCYLMYEATVAAALPIFSLYRECLQADRIIRISGILNGTTNYILSKMFFEGTSFELSLKEAQERGYAEKDPSYDIDGIDAACKVVILGNAIMGKKLRFKDVKRRGIRDVTQEAVELAKRSGYAIKLVGVVDDEPEVSPRLVPLRHPLCVHGNLNAVHFETDLAKEITIIGYGAGKETVSAVLNDVLSILKKRVIR
ncbi:MAG TPA: homoserine dehydrogenase [Candidatus Bathyarchaeota archaeon]|nr:homoserine dehydrogenase [Candidatus Bathyarchaeota archaeon]